MILLLILDAIHRVVFYHTSDAELPCATDARNARILTEAIRGRFPGRTAQLTLVLYHTRSFITLIAPGTVSVLKTIIGIVRERRVSVPRVYIPLVLTCSPTLRLSLAVFRGSWLNNAMLFGQTACNLCVFL